MIGRAGDHGGGEMCCGVHTPFLHATTLCQKHGPPLHVPFPVHFVPGAGHGSRGASQIHVGGVGGRIAPPHCG